MFTCSLAKRSAKTYLSSTTSQNYVRDSRLGPGAWSLRPRQRPQQKHLQHPIYSSAFKLLLLDVSFFLPVHLIAFSCCLNYRFFISWDFSLSSLWLAIFLSPGFFAAILALDAHRSYEGSPLVQPPWLPTRVSKTCPRNFFVRGWRLRSSTPGERDFGILPRRVALAGGGIIPGPFASCPRWWILQPL